MKSKDKNEVKSIINELQGMILRDAPQSADEAIKEQQRIDEIWAILEAKAAQVPGMQSILDTMPRKRGE